MKRLSRHLIIAEGADSSGKTSLCNHLIEKYRFNYYHCGVLPDIKKYHDNVLNLVFTDIIQHDSNFIIDRLHLSEEVYGNIFRNKVQYNWHEYNNYIIDKCKNNNITYTLIMCLPPKEYVIKGHASRNADGNEMFDTVDPVYDSYLKIYDENQNVVQMYRYDFTQDSDYNKLDIYLENL